MREILFKAKRTDNGEWVEGDLIHITYDTNGITRKAIKQIYSTPTEVHPETVCQYTGLKDKNGTKIFEGDNIVLTQEYDEVFGYGAISFIRGGFQCHDLVLQDTYSMNLIIEVTGNIHDK